MKCHAVPLAALLSLTIAAGAVPAKAQTIAIFTKSQGNPVARAFRAGTETAAKALGVKVMHFIPTSADNPEQQTALLEDAVRNKPDAVVLSPVDTKALVPAAQKAVAAGIPVINAVDRLAGGTVVAYVGSDDHAIALATAQTLLKAMDGKGNVVILEGPPNVPTSVGRVKGFNDALKEFPQVKLLTSKAAAYARPAALDVMKGLLRQYPQIDGVLAANDAMAMGALDALKAAGKKALIAGINGGKEAVDLIKAGDMVASGEYNGFAEGCLALEIAVRNLRKEETPKEAILKSVVIDKANVQSFETPVERRPCPTLASIAK